MLHSGLASLKQLLFQTNHSKDSLASSTNVLCWDEQ